MNKNVKSTRAKPMADGGETISGGGGDGLRSRQRNSLKAQSVASRASAGSQRSFEYAKNPFGILIKKCCASCQWKQLTDSLITRKCRRWKKKVKPRHCCRSWSLRAKLLKLQMRNVKI